MISNAKYWTKDYIHMFRGQVISYIHRTSPVNYTRKTESNNSPVIILPGLMEKWGFMKRLADKIVESGHNVYLVPKLGNNLMDIPSCAAIVKQVINENNLSYVTLLAHSKGGLIGKYVLVHHNKDKKIKRLIAIATPFSGSTRGGFIPHKAFRELQPNSEVIKDLKVHSEVNKHIVSISPTYDNHVVSPSGCYLEGATNITVEVHGHHTVLFNSQVNTKILELLSTS